MRALRRAPQTRQRSGSPRYLALASFAFLCGGATVQAAPFGAVIEPPIAVSSVAPDRQALIVATGHTSATADAPRYRDLLRLLGFEVTLVQPETRPALKDAFSAFAGHVKPGADVAVFVLGGLLPKGQDLYVFADETEPKPQQRPEQYATEGLRLGDAIRPLTASGAVVFVDSCRDANAQACRAGTASLPEGISAIVGERLAPKGDGAPVAGLGSLGGDMMPLMQRESLSYLALFGVLAPQLTGTDMSVAATPSLSRGFAFLPMGFLAGLPSACNRVDPNASADTLRAAAPVDRLIPACAEAATKWSFTPWFKIRLAAAREQAAFQRAANGCKPGLARAYLQAYPDGRFASTLRGVEEGCESERRRATAPVSTPTSAPTAVAQPETTPELAICTVGRLDPAGNNWLALRGAPNYQASWSSTRMGPGTSVSAFERSGTWVHVRLASGETGWANGNFLDCSAGRPSAPSRNACIVDGLDPAGDNWLALRSSPNPKAGWSQRHMGPGTPLAVFGSSGPWLHVRLETGETGWAYSEYVRCPR